MTLPVHLLELCMLKFPQTQASPYVLLVYTGELTATGTTTPSQADIESTTAGRQPACKVVHQHTAASLQPPPIYILQQ